MKVDGWTITLFVVAFLPWLRTVFESVGFPGGGSVTWRRKVEAEQERQAADIQALRFLTARFLTAQEREVLQRFASDEPISTDGKDATQTQAIWERVASLKRSGLIDTKPEILELVRRGESGQLSTINDAYQISESGREYLDLVAQLPADVD